MLAEFVDSVLIIDDKKEEIKPLQKSLNSRQINNIYFTPKQLQKPRKGFKLNHKKLIFLDLYVDESGYPLETQISLIQNIFKKNIPSDFGSYGLILWTKHEEDFSKFEERFFSVKDMYQLPFFATSLNKNKYLQSKSGFNSIFDDLSEKLDGNKLAKFFMTFDGIVNHAKNNLLNDLYSTLGNDIPKKQDELVNTLYHLAKNHTGIHKEQIAKDDLEKDAISACSEILLPYIQNPKAYKLDLFSSLTGEDGKLLLDPQNNNPVEPAIDNLKKSKINNKLFISYTENSDVIFPGNVYKINNAENHPLSMTGQLAKDFSVINTDIPVLIELTPPCDFAQKKFKYRRCVGGLLMVFDENRVKKTKSLPDSFYNELKAIELMIDGELKAYHIIFNFHYLYTYEENVLKDTASYTLLFKVKEKLFADILQKFSSHAARLGVGVIH